LHYASFHYRKICFAWNKSNWSHRD